MHIIFSRKGFDQSSGGAPSPIVDGRPVSLPIPAKDRSHTTYADLGLGEIVEDITRGRIGRDHLCHEDPVFTDGRCAFGQTGAAQSHLTNQGIEPGDVFLFFGLFSTNGSRTDKHHRIFGYMEVEAIRHLGSRPRIKHLKGFKRRHPHTVGEWHANNTIYTGKGALARHAPDTLRLTAGAGQTSIWHIPPWLHQTGLTYHGNEKRWLPDNRLQTAARGQEFVAPVDGVPAARRWLARIIEEIRGAE